MDNNDLYRDQSDDEGPTTPLRKSRSKHQRAKTCGALDMSFLTEESAGFSLQMPPASTAVPAANSTNKEAELEHIEKSSSLPLNLTNSIQLRRTASTPTSAQSSRTKRAMSPWRWNSNRSSQQQSQSSSSSLQGSSPKREENNANEQSEEEEEEEDSLVLVAAQPVTTTTSSTSSAEQEDAPIVTEVLCGSNSSDLRQQSHSSEQSLGNNTQNNNTMVVLGFASTDASTTSPVMSSKNVASSSSSSPEQPTAKMMTPPTTNETRHQPRGSNTTDIVTSFTASPPESPFDSGDDASLQNNEGIEATYEDHPNHSWWRKKRRCVATVLLVVLFLLVILGVVVGVLVAVGGVGGSSSSKDLNPGGSDKDGDDQVEPGLPPSFAPPVGFTTPAPTPLRGSVSPADPLPNDSCLRAVGPLTINGYPEFASLDHDPPLTSPHGLLSTCQSSSAVDDDQTVIAAGGIVPFPAGRWYQVMGGDEVLRVSTCDPTGEHTAIDTQIAVYRGWCGGESPHSRLLCVGANDDFCGKQSSLSWYAEKGVMYYMFVYTTAAPDIPGSTTTSDAVVVSQTAEQPQHDLFHKDSIDNNLFRLRVTYEDNGLCPMAIGPIDNTGKVVIGSMRGASLEPALTCSWFSARFGQVWYRVVGTGGWMAASTCHPVTNFEARIDVLSDACGSGICAGVRDSDCGNGYRLVWNSEVGVDYYILIYKSTNLPGTLFGLTVDSFEPTENDVCTDAIPLELNGGIVKGATWTATPDNDIPTDLSGSERRRCNLLRNSQPGVWYTVRGTGDTLLVSTCNSQTDFATKISVFRRGCDVLDCLETTAQFCNEKASVYFDSVMGQDYLIYVHGADYGVSANIGNFGIEVSVFVPEPNDMCVDAIPLTADGERVLGSTFAATKDDATNFCTGFESDGNGVWYKIVGTGVALRAATCDPTTQFDTLITIYQGSCDSLSCVIADDNSCGIQSSAKWVALEGVTYYIHIHGKQASSVGDFALIVEEFTPTEENDFCDGAFTIPSSGALTLGSTETATFDNAGDCFGVVNSAPGVWYRIVGRGTLVVASLCHPQTRYDTALSVYTGTCTDLQCRLGNADAGKPGCGRQSEMSWVAQPGISYYLLVHGYDVRTGPFGLTVSEPKSAVDNDYCVNAIPLNLSKGTISGTTIEATNDEAPSCTDVEQTGPGVWYTVVGDGNRIIASTCGEMTDFDTRISVYEGACGSSTCVRANDDTCGEQSTVVWSSKRGIKYYILVHGDKEGNFGLKVDRFVPAQPNDQCRTAIGPILPDDRLILGSTVGASFDDTGTCSGVSNSGPGVWYFVLGTGERLKADTCNSATNFDSKLSVFTGLECGILQCVAGNDDGCGLRSSVTWETSVGELYWVLVHGFGTTKVGNFGLTVTGSDIFR